MVAGPDLALADVFALHTGFVFGLCSGLGSLAAAAASPAGPSASSLILESFPSTCSSVPQDCGALTRAVRTSPPVRKRTRRVFEHRACVAAFASQWGA